MSANNPEQPSQPNDDKRQNAAEWLSRRMSDYRADHQEPTPPPNPEQQAAKQAMFDAHHASVEDYAGRSLWNERGNSQYDDPKSMNN